MNTLDGYLAFSEHSAWPVEMAGGPTPQMFGPPYTYIPFAGTPENAIQNAMCSRKALPQAAAQPTQMYVLKVSITSERLLELFKSGVVVQGSGLVAWRHYGEFKLNNVRFQHLGRRQTSHLRRPMLHCMCDWFDVTLFIIFYS